MSTSNPVTVTWNFRPLPTNAENGTPTTNHHPSNHNQANSTINMIGAVIGPVQGPFEEGARSFQTIAECLAYYWNELAGLGQQVTGLVDGSDAGLQAIRRTLSEHESELSDHENRISSLEASGPGGGGDGSGGDGGGDGGGGDPGPQPWAIFSPVDVVSYNPVARTAVIAAFGQQATVLNVSSVGLEPGARVYITPDANGDLILTSVISSASWEPLTP